eukprot:15169349-Alexandrium_andersonii.AAC.1
MLEPRKFEHHAQHQTWNPALTRARHKAGKEGGHWGRGGQAQEQQKGTRAIHSQRMTAAQGRMRAA